MRHHLSLHLHNAVEMLAQRRRCWASIATAMCRSLRSAGDGRADEPSVTWPVSHRALIGQIAICGRILHGVESIGKIGGRLRSVRPLTVLTTT